MSKFEDLSLESLCALIYEARAFHGLSHVEKELITRLKKSGHLSEDFKGLVGLAQKQSLNKIPCRTCGQDNCEVKHWNSVEEEEEFYKSAIKEALSDNDVSDVLHYAGRWAELREQENGNNLAPRRIIWKWMTE